MHPGAVLASLLALAAAGGACSWVLYERQSDARVRFSEAAKNKAALQSTDAAQQAALDKLTSENTELRKKLAEAMEAAKPAPTPGEVAERVRASRNLAFVRLPEWVPAPSEEILKRLAAQAVAPVTPEMASARARAAKAMSFVTIDFDYREAVANLAQARPGGFYDPATNKFLFQSDTSLARADARENFAGAILPVLIAQNFARAPQPEPDNDDALLAAQALARGDASFHRVYFSLNDRLRTNFDQGQAPTPPPPPSAPQFLTEMWKWSEDSGNLFAQTLHQKGGVSAINNAYARPPRSTAEILHPEELYLASPPFAPVSITFPDTSVSGTPALFTNVVGEAALFFHVRSWADQDAADLATVGWAGDRYVVWPGGKEGDHVLWRSVWRTEGDAKEFFAVLRTGLMSRHLIPWQKEYDAIPGQFRVDEPHRVLRLRMDGKTVTLINATDPAFAKAMEEKFDATR